MEYSWRRLVYNYAAGAHVCAECHAGVFLTTTAVEQIVGRERRERVSQLA